jgi:hypothetical protein
METAVIVHGGGCRASAIAQPMRQVVMPR